MNILSDFMVWVFWGGAALIIVIDIVLAIASRRTFTRRARRFGRDVPVVAYFVGLLPCHIWYNVPLVSLPWGVVIMLGVGGFIIAWEVILDAPMHPIIAFSLGLPMGMFFFPG